MKKSSGPSRYWKTQVPVDYIDTSLVINTWETVVANLSGGKPARLWYIIIEQTNNGATAENLELEITINGTAYTVTVTADSAGQYFVFLQYARAAGDFSFAVGAKDTAYTVLSAALSSHSSMPFTAASVGLIRVRQTTDVDGTSAQIEVNIVWDRLEP